MSLVLQVFGHKPKYWTHYHVDLMMVRDEKLLQFILQGTRMSEPHFIHPTELRHVVQNNNVNLLVGGILQLGGAIA